MTAETDPLPWQISGARYVRVLEWVDEGAHPALDIYLAFENPGMDNDGALFWLSQGNDLISIPIEAMEAFVASIIRAGVELGANDA